MLPGHATFQNLSCYSSYDEKTSSRWYAKEFDFVSLNKAAITHVTPPEHEQTNVYWATKDIQMRNTRRTHWITYHGATRCMKDWAIILGISYFTLADRLKRWTVERAFTLPIHANTPRHA
jgi:hypothetical protein